MNTKVSENLNCMFSKAIEYLEKWNTLMNTTHSKTNLLPKNSSNTKQMTRIQNIWIKVRRHKAVKWSEL